MILSGEMMEVLDGREVDFEVGRETAALTAAAMVNAKTKKRWKKWRVGVVGGGGEDQKRVR